MATVSLCMIVKNEARVLARCLDSFRNLVDEIVIVDTGSTDETKEIASRYTQRVYDFTWVDDFAAARNYAFSLTSCEYIYSADADELIDEENGARFLALKEAIAPEVEIVQMWYVNRHSYQTTENYERDLRPKLYRRLRQFRWIDPVHETVSLTPLVYDSGIEIQHWPEESHAGRDFTVFQRAIGRGERLSKKLLHMYAQELYLAGTVQDFAAARGYFAEALYDEARDAEERTDVYCVLARADRLAGDRDGFYKWCLKSISVAPASEICCELAQHYYDIGDDEEASVWCQNAAEETAPVLDVRTGGERPYLLLAQCYERQAGLHPEVSAQCLSAAAEYKARSMECAARRKGEG